MSHDEPGQLSEIDALLWAVDKDRRLGNTVSSVALLDRSISADVVVSRILRACNRTARLRQRIVEGAAPLQRPRWEPDPEFAVSNHFVEQQCAGAGDMREVLDIAERFVAEPFDTEHPLFRFLLVHGLDGDRDALIMKAHHAIADGLGMLAIQLGLFDLEPDTSDPTPAPTIVDEPAPRAHTTRRPLDQTFQTELTRSLGALADMARVVVADADTPGDAVERGLDLLGSGARALLPVEPLSPLLQRRSADTRLNVISLPLADLKAAGHRAGTRMNAVFVAAVARGLGMFHDESGAPAPVLRMGMPVSRRPTGAAAGSGNFLTPLRVELPLTAEESVHLVQIVQALIDNHRLDPAADIIDPAARLASRLPAALAAKALGHVLRGSDFLTSNLAGSSAPLFLGPARLVAQFPFGPTSAAALNATLLSYGDEAHVGVAIDAEATDRPAELVDCITRGFAWVLAKP